MGEDTFYITTPIYYPNDVPHIGSAYTTVAVDVIARHYRMLGREATVIELLNRVRDNGKDDIYLGSYEGLYCVACEAYYTEEELNQEGNCPIHDRPVEVLQQENYFFRLSAYQDWLLAYHEEHPDF